MKVCIISIAYNRPIHIKKSIESIKYANRNTKFPYRIYIDGPKSSEDIGPSNVEKVARNFGIEYIQMHKNNLGLRGNVFLAISNAFEDYEFIVVVEDDIVLHPSALEFMDYYSKHLNDNKKVGSISLTNTLDINPLTNYFFRLTSSWGWGTWRDRWKDFAIDETIEYELNEKNLMSYLNLGVEEMFSSQFRLNDTDRKTWAIYWYAFNVLQKRLSFYPRMSLAENIGLDGTGTNHGTSTINLRSDFTDTFLAFDNIIEVKEPVVIVNSYVRNSLNERKIISRLLRKMKGYGKKITNI